MKIAVIGDPHLGCSTYTDKRISDFSKQFNLSIDEALKRKVSAVFLLGDVFDSSAYRRSVDNFAACVGDVAESFVKLKEAGIEVFAIGGNHEYGRGRRGGELRVLSDLKVIVFLDDEIREFNGYRIAGVSWKSDPDSFKAALKKLGKPTTNSILLMHQFCEGSHRIPANVAEIKKADIEDWPVVFTGHHHQYEDLGFAVTPGSLEVHFAKEVGKKGFVVYDTSTNMHEFVILPPSRDIRYTEMNGNGESSKDFQKAIETWIRVNASAGALLVIHIDGTLASGRSADIEWQHLRSIGYQLGGLKVYFDGGLQDQVRTAPEIRATVNFQDFIRKRFSSRQKQAIQYIDSFREKGDEFSTEILDGIIEEAGGKKR